MRTSPIAKALLFFLAIIWSIAAVAEITIPPLSTRVTDVTGTLTTDQRAMLEQNLNAFEIKKGAQIVVLIVGSTAPEAIEQYSLRVVEQWKLGRKKVDDGALLIIAKDDRTMRIEVGYGLEGALSDAVSKRIISETITPLFKQGDFYGGITAGVNSMMTVVSGEALPEPVLGAANDGDNWGRFLPVIFIVVLAAGGFLSSVLGRLPGAIVTGGITAVLAWAMIGAISVSAFAGVLALIVTLLGGGMRGTSLGYYGGLGGLGGRGGGGFSGGGGGFGGGGASGRW